jgi:hypothetical protein
VKIKFTGRVLPAALQLSHDFGSTIAWNLESSGLTAFFQIRVLLGEVTVDCEIDGEITKNVMETLYVRALDIASAEVDLVSFSSKIGFTVILDRFVDGNGVTNEIMPNVGGLPVTCTAYNLDKAGSEEFRKIHTIVLSEPAIFMALNDLILAISRAHCAPINCARAVEGIRHLIAPGLDAKKQWIKFNNALRVDKSYVDPIILNSFNHRHGYRVRIDGKIINDIVVRSWSIMNRFLEYKSRGGNPLPLSEFPVLI